MKVSRRILFAKRLIIAVIHRHSRSAPRSFICVMLLITQGADDRFVINPRSFPFLHFPTISIVHCIVIAYRFSSRSHSKSVAAAADSRKKAGEELNEAFLLFNLTAKSEEKEKKLFTLPSAVAVWITKKTPSGEIRRKMQLLYSNCRVFLKR